jgi:glyoxylase-like metal-dependent hydrolase (beta-lactamase superfamily II)
VLNIKTLTVGEMETSCYLVSSSSDGDTEGGSSEVERKCLIIDPGDDADFITQTILENKLRPTAIVLTHGHFDHALGCLELKLNYDIPILLHKNDLKLYSSANQSALHWLKKKTLKVPPIDQFIKEGDEIKIGDEFLTVLETPGHTPGSICLVYHPKTTNNSKANSSLAMRDDITTSNVIIFSGDTLFKDGVGRTDFSYSSPSDLQSSLRKLKSLIHQTFPLSKGESKGVIIYPGHGETTVL